MHKALIDDENKQPSCNVKFMIEGEEVGSDNLALRKNKEIK